jgi:prevent-host-death family protein
MADVSIRELRNKGGEIVDRAASGERITITRGGKPVAELSPLRQELTTEALLDRWRHLPSIDYEQFRSDVDEVMGASIFDE